MFVNKEKVCELVKLVKDNPDLEVAVIRGSSINKRDDSYLFGKVTDLLHGGSGNILFGEDDHVVYSWDKVYIGEYCVIDGEYFLKDIDYRRMLIIKDARNVDKFKDLGDQEFVYKDMDSLDNRSWKKVIIVVLNVDERFKK